MPAVAVDHMTLDARTEAPTMAGEGHPLRHRAGHRGGRRAGAQATKEDVMFICENCKEVTAPGTKETRVVVETRPMHYANGGHGSEIVREERRCPECCP